MTHPVKGIDHCFALVDDLDAAAAQFKALGFTLSPRGAHSAAKGTANYTIMFPNDYFELLGILAPTELNAARRETLATQGQGLHAIACRINDAEEAAKALSALGIATQGLGSFSRPVPLPDGSEGVAAFSTVAFTPEETPLGSVFMCQHKTRETVWIPELFDHANTACGLDAILAISETPEEDAKTFARLWAAGQISEVEGGYKISTGPNSASLILCTPNAMAARYPAANLAATAQGAFTTLRLKTRDLDRLKSCLEKSDVAFSETLKGVCVGPEFAAGVVMEFVPA
jgi:hypothetical protein